MRLTRVANACIHHRCEAISDNACRPSGTHRHPLDLDGTRGAGERLFNAPLTIEPMSTTTFSRGAVAHVFAAHP